MRSIYYAKITEERGRLKATLLKPGSPPIDNVVFEVLLPPPLSKMRLVAFYEMTHARALDYATNRINEVLAAVTLAEGDASYFERL
jgi:hypothetical protein